MLTKKKVIVSSVSMLAVLFAVLPSLITQKYKVNAVEQNTQFEVNVKESLSIAVTSPTEWAVGDINTFLRNKISIDVSSNNANGFVATMTTKTNNTDLIHTADKGTIHTLTSSNARDNSFPANRWGYSLTDTDAGDTSSIYNALVGAGSTPITLISNAESSTIHSKDIYFGAKADSSVASGTYTGTVVISVVTGTIDEDPSSPGYNPTTPVNPATPNSNEGTASYSGANTTTGGTSNGATIYSYSRSTSSTSTTVTQVSDGDNRDAYSQYTPPMGVSNRGGTGNKTTTIENVSPGSSLAMGLAVTSAVAATSGILFFILAKRKKDEEDEEDEL